MIFVFDKLVESDTTKFEIPKFNENNFAMWKVMIVQLKEGCTIAFKGRNLKPQGMIYA